MERRDSDIKINKLIEDVALLQKQMVDNTVLTQEVKSLLDSFKAIEKVTSFLLKIAKVFSILAGTYIAAKTLFLGHKP